MIGNDIIDIPITRKTTNWERAGFMDKIFSSKEQQTIHASIDPFLTVWQLWSMKESAYKVFIQSGGKRFFMPSTIECQLDTLENGMVNIDKTRFFTRTSIQSDYIFTTATKGSPYIDTCIFNLPNLSSSEQSSFMYQNVITDYAESQRLKKAELSIQKSKTGVPHLYMGNRRLNTSLSISHHGNYGAYSLLKNKAK